jgi:Dienelactone hydrolase family
MQSTTRRIELTLSSGRKVVGDLAPSPNGPAGGVMLIHEWWGLNDEMRALARKLADEGFTALAVDLFDGESTGDRNRARELILSFLGASACSRVESACYCCPSRRPRREVSPIVPLFVFGGEEDHSMWMCRPSGDIAAKIELEILIELQTIAENVDNVDLHVAL